MKVTQEVFRKACLPSRAFRLLSPPVSNSIENSKQWSGRFLGIIGWDPRVCKSYQLHVDILWFSFIKWGFILQITLKRSVIFVQFWISTGYFSNSTGSSITNCWFSPIIDSKIIMSFSFLFLFEIEGRHASAKAQVVVDHLVRFPSSREEISQPGIEPPTSSLRFGYLCTIIRYLGSSWTNQRLSCQVSE